MLDAHGRCLRALAAAAGQHFEGLAQASRCRLLGVPPKFRRRLRELDTVSAWIRHVTVPRVDLLLQEVTAACTPSPSAAFYASDFVKDPFEHGVTDYWDDMDTGIVEDDSSVAGLDLVDIAGASTDVDAVSDTTFDAFEDVFSIFAEIRSVA